MAMLVVLTVQGLDGHAGGKQAVQVLLGHLVRLGCLLQLCKELFAVTSIGRIHLKHLHRNIHEYIKNMVQLFSLRMKCF